MSKWIDEEVENIAQINAMSQEPLCSDCRDEGYVYWSAQGAEYSHIEDDYFPVEVPMRAPCPNGCKPPISTKGDKNV